MLRILICFTYCLVCYSYFDKKTEYDYQEFIGKYGKKSKFGNENVND